MRAQFEDWYRKLHQQYRSDPTVQHFLSPEATKAEALALARNVCKAHLRSPQILGFLYALAAPASVGHIKENLLEELGLHDDHCSHPELLRRLGQAIGFEAKEWAEIEAEAEQVLKNKIQEPVMFGTMMESGLNVMLEVFGFEWFLAREASTLGKRLRELLGLSQDDLEWFFHHSEVDIAHAEEGLDTLVDYVSYFGLDADSVRNIGEITLRGNIFLRRYFDVQAETGL